jgi:ABC-type multidrug transport system permease subunit
MHAISKYISYAIPYTYGVQAIRHINLVGAGFSDIWPDLIILFGFIVAQALLATQVLKREIK